MKNTLGWLLVTLGLCLTSTGWADTNHQGTEEEAVTSDGKTKGYRFDADRFSQAMDRASGTPVSDGGGSPVLHTSDTSLSRVLGKTVLSLIVVIGAIYGLTYFLRNFSVKTPFQNLGPLRVMAKQSLSQKSSVYVVSTLNRFLIIGESAQGLTCLSEFDNPEEVERLKSEWGWDTNERSEKPSKTAHVHSKFAPALESHIDDLERGSLREYEEVGR